MCTDYESLTKTRRTETEAENVLAKLGFDDEAVGAALQDGGGLTTAHKAACRFAAVRRNLDEDTLLAASSKVYPQTHQEI